MPRLALCLYPVLSDCWILQDEAQTWEQYCATRRISDSNHFLIGARVLWTARCCKSYDLRNNRSELISKRIYRVQKHLYSLNFLIWLSHALHYDINEALFYCTMLKIWKIISQSKRKSITQIDLKIKCHCSSNGDQRAGVSHQLACEGATVYVNKGRSW